MDADHDGKLSGKEISAWMQKLGLSTSEKSMLHLMALRDNRKRGSLDFQGFVGLNRDSVPEDETEASNKEASRQKILMEAFEIFDKDHDGLISPKELCRTLEDLGLMDNRQEDSEYVNMIKQNDFDGDGQINFTDFENMMNHKDGKSDKCT
ncbi:hypothetical protein KP509_12G027000 [Ceratopteris richardii]|nr:hypothetical protein KP509_12G027000 [Ceratopteris richardii]